MGLPRLRYDRRGKAKGKPTSAATRRKYTSTAYLREQANTAQLQTEMKLIREWPCVEPAK